MSRHGVGLPVLLLVVAIGLAAGIGLGLVIAWIAWPAQTTSVDIADLKGSAQDDYIVLTASSFAFDRDLARARQRLALVHADKMDGRLSDLARGLTDAGRPEARYVAALAIALGSPDKDLAQIAATPSPTRTSTPFPTPVATLLVPTITPINTSAPTSLPRTSTPQRSNTPTRTSTAKPNATVASAGPTSTRTATPRPSATSPAPVAPLSMTWNPDRSGWPGGVYVTGASVAPGQKYWKLVSAQYCDVSDSPNNCANLPGGLDGWGIYVMIRDEGGNRAEAPVFIGSTQSTDVKSASDMCNCNYSLTISDAPITVGNYPSDAMGGMGMVSVYKNWSARSHVRYFLTFQLTTR